MSLCCGIVYFGTFIYFMKIPHTWKYNILFSSGWNALNPLAREIWEQILSYLSCFYVKHRTFEDHTRLKMTETIRNDAQCTWKCKDISCLSFSAAQYVRHFHILLFWSCFTVLEAELHSLPDHLWSTWYAKERWPGADWGLVSGYPREETRESDISPCPMTRWSNSDPSSWSISACRSHSRIHSTTISWSHV